MIIEICTEKLETAIIADQMGAQRIELCSALDLGGLTPSIGMIEQCVQHCTLEVHAIIRSVTGGFVYPDDVIEIMKHDIKASHIAGAKGVVFGCLTKANELNLEQNKLLLDYAKSFGLKVTFHRAIDFCTDISAALEILIIQGFDRILTSGKASTAIQGIKNIRKLVAQSNGRIEIMAGSGVNPENALELINTGVDALHFTARKRTNEKELLGMGNEFETDREKIRGIVDKLNMSLAKWKFTKEGGND